MLGRVTRALLLATAALALSGCGYIPDAVTEQGEEAVTLWNGVIIAGVAVAVFMYVLILGAAFKGRAKNRKDPDAVPGQRQDNLRLELVYFVIPILICAALFGFSYPREREIVAVSDDPDLVVEVVGYQWGWQFRYAGPDGDPGAAGDAVVVTGSPDTPPTMVLPVGRTVRLELVSDDVIHSFWVPDFVSKRDLIPGVDNEIDVNLTETGTFVGRCAEFCGLEHWSMSFQVQSVSPDDFDAWLVDAAAAEQPIIGSLPS